MRHKIFFSTILFSLLLFLGNSVELISAQGGASTTHTFPYPFQNTSTEVNNACEPEMQQFASRELEDFRNFLEQNFQNKSSTTSLLPIAIQKYRDMRAELMTGYSKYYPNQGAWLLTTGLQPNACLKIIQDKLGDAKVLLKYHVVRTSGVKKDTALLEKYQSINQQLQGLNQQFTTMKALLNTFSQKLPCYVAPGACIKGV